MCRSPLAEAIFSHLVKEAGIADKVKVDSAASGLWEVGSPTHPRIISILKARGIDYQHTARLLRPEDLTKFGYILGMDNDVLRSIWAIGKGPAKIQPFVKYTPHLKIEQVPDPMRSGDFDETYSIVLSGCQFFLAFLRQTHDI